MKKETYCKDYFENGIKKGISCYENYKWQETRTLETVSEIIRKCKIERKDSILDFGCAKGYLVKAFHWLGYTKTFGTDISEYATKNSDKEIKDYIFKTDQLNYYKKFNVIICKDVAEHINYKDIDSFLKVINKFTKDKLVLIIPLGNGNNYNIPRFNLDTTHKIKENKEWWLKKVKLAGFKEIVFATDNLKHIKPNYNVPNGNLMICARKRRWWFRWLKKITG